MLNTTTAPSTTAQQEAREARAVVNDLFMAAQRSLRGKHGVQLFTLDQLMEEMREIAVSSR